MANIVVAFSKFEDATNIRNLLVRNGYSVTSTCTSGSNVLSVIDDYNDGIIICGYKLQDMLYDELRANLPETFEMIILASQAKISDISGNGIVSVVMPLRVQDLVNTIDVISNNIYIRKKKRQEKAKIRDPKDQKIIDQAKKVLMEKNNLTEFEAHRYLQKNSMDSGSSMVETAEKVISIMMT